VGKRLKPYLYSPLEKVEERGEGENVVEKRIYIQREIICVPVTTSMTTDEVRDSAFDRDIIEVLLAHQRRIEALGQVIRRGTYRQVIVPRGDPPCVVCGAWSDDWLCPRCRSKYPWMRP
jgi:hypothetical protein